MIRICEDAIASAQHWTWRVEADERHARLRPAGRARHASPATRSHGPASDRPTQRPPTESNANHQGEAGTRENRPLTDSEPRPSPHHDAAHNSAPPQDGLSHHCMREPAARRHPGAYAGTLPSARIGSPAALSPIASTRSLSGSSTPASASTRIPRFASRLRSIQALTCSAIRWTSTDDAWVSPRRWENSLRKGGSPWRRTCAQIASRASRCRSGPEPVPLSTSTAREWFRVLRG